MTEEINPKNDKRFGNWQPRIFDHKEELMNSVEKEGSMHIGRDTDFPVTGAEIILTLMLASMRGIPFFLENQKNEVWRHEQFQTLNRKRIGLIGNGGMHGRVKEVILTLYPFAEVYCFSQHGQNESFTMDKFDALLPKLDVVSIAVPNKEDTVNLFNADRIKMLKDGALLVNISKGIVLDQEELTKHLYDKRIFAAIDQTEPVVLPEGHPLWKAPNLIMTPHIGINVR